MVEHNSFNLLSFVLTSLKLDDEDVKLCLVFVISEPLSNLMTPIS